MKKSLSISLILGITLFFSSWAMAGSNPSCNEVPEIFTCEPPGDGLVYIDWDEVNCAKKYSIDVEVLLSGQWDVNGFTVVKLSFGTGDRTDGAPISQSDLSIDESEFTYWDGLQWVDLSGYEARAKVKALNPPGKKGQSQNNPFSDWCYFPIPEARLHQPI